MGNEEIPTEGQIDIVKQMNDLLVEQAKLWETVAKSMGAAMSASQAMKGATEQQTQASTQQVNVGPAVVESLQQQTDGANALAEALGRKKDSEEKAGN